MTLYFVTGNRNKLAEVRAILPQAEMPPIRIDAPEPQSMNLREIVEQKCAYSRDALYPRILHSDHMFVEDVSLELMCMDGFPGPLIKWMLKSMKAEGIGKVVEQLGNQEAVVRCGIGYTDDSGDIEYFESELPGRIVSPRGASRFGFDPIFVPQGYDVTYAEMGVEEKNRISHRALALEMLRDHLIRLERLD